MPTNPQSLALLRRSSLNIPGVDDVQVSPDVMEAAPDLSLDTPKTAYEVAANERLKQMLGLGERSPQFKQQEADLALRDKALNEAQVAQIPEVSAEADKAYQEKLGIAGEGARVAAEGNLAVEKQKQVPMMDYLSGRAGTDESGAPMRFRPTITENGITLSGISEPTQVAAQQHAAQVGLSQYPAMRQIIDTLNHHGLIGPMAGRFADAATSTGLDSYLMSPESRRAFNDFKAQASLMKSNMALVHGGSRGGGSPAIAARFDQLVNMAQSPEALKGAIDAFERWQTQYANAKSSAEMDAADAALGVTGGPYTGGDQGNPWSTPPTPTELGSR